MPELMEHRKTDIVRQYVLTAAQNSLQDTVQRFTVLRIFLRNYFDETWRMSYCRPTDYYAILAKVVRRSEIPGGWGSEYSLLLSRSAELFIGISGGEPGDPYPVSRDVPSQQYFVSPAEIPEWAWEELLVTLATLSDPVPSLEFLSKVLEFKIVSA